MHSNLSAVQVARAGNAVEGCTGEESGITAAQAVANLTEAIAVVQGLVVDGRLPVPGAEALPLAGALHAAADTVRALAVSATAVADELDAARAAGCRSTSHWLESAGGMCRAAAGATAALSRTLATGFAATRRAWLAGQVTEDAVREVTRGVSRAVADLPAEEAEALRPELEDRLLAVARTATVADVRRAAARLRIAADPCGAEAAQLRAHDEQYLRFTPVPDGVEVHGRLTSTAAAALITALDRVVDRYVRFGDMTYEQGAALASAQPARRAMAREHLVARALVDVAETALGAALLGHQREVRPHVVYTVHHDEVEAGLGGWLRLPGLDEVPLPPASIDRVLCDADVHPVLTRRPDDPGGGRVRGGDGASAPPSLREAFAVPLDPSGPDYVDGDDAESCSRRQCGQRGRHVLDLGRTFRTAPAPLRRALEVRDRHCVFPGCSVDPSRCEAHHVVHWRHGGETSLRNMALLCLAHHHAVHEGGWTIAAKRGSDPGDPDRWTFTGPLWVGHPDD